MTAIESEVDLRTRFAAMRRTSVEATWLGPRPGAPPKDLREGLFPRLCSEDLPRAWSCATGSKPSGKCARPRIEQALVDARGACV
jgi:hypothetical protein